MSSFLTTPKSASCLSKQDALSLLDIIHSSHGCTTKEDLHGLVRRLEGLIPVEFFTCVYSTSNKEGLLEPYHVINVNFPQEWVDLYVEKKYHTVDPVIMENFSKYTIQFWADTYCKYEPPKGFVSLAEDFGLSSGYTHGVRNFKGNKGSLFSASGRKLKRSARTEAVLELITPHVHLALERIESRDRADKLSSLSRREKEVLKWISQGKTTWDTSAILGISERTVKYHVDSIMRKLDAVSRIHAAAIAGEAGLVDLE